MQCTKVRYSRYEHARDALIRVRKQTNYRGEVYTCGLCGGLHIGRRMKTIKKDVLAACRRLSVVTAS